MIPGCGKEQPPDEKDMVRYVQYDWQIDASYEEIREVLALEDELSGDDFYSEIGGILTINSMEKDMDRGDYADASWKAVEWLAKDFLTQESSYSWLSGYILLGVLLYKYYEWLYEEVQEGAFNAQVSYYLYYRREGESEGDIERYYQAPNNGYLINPSGRGTVAPSSSKFTPEDVFVIGEAFWKAEQAEKHRAEDEEAIKQSFINALEQLREGEVTPEPSPEPSSPPESVSLPAGTYVNQDNPDERIDFSLDSFSLMRGLATVCTGSCKVRDNTIVCSPYLDWLCSGYSFESKNQGSKLIDQNGEVWVKQ